MTTFLLILFAFGCCWLAWHHVDILKARSLAAEAQKAAELAKQDAAKALAEAQRIGEETVATATKVLAEAKATLTRAHRKTGK